jgi:hypothetical protein
MRIVIDIQGAQTAGQFRGIGRYTLLRVTFRFFGKWREITPFTSRAMTLKC